MPWTNPEYDQDLENKCLYCKEECQNTFCNRECEEAYIND